MSTVRAKDSFQVYVDRGKPTGQLISVVAGDLFDSGHVAVKGREHLFDSVEDYVLDPGRKKTSQTRGEKSKPSEKLMERTTSEPGERRSVDAKSGIVKDTQGDSEKDAETKRVAERRAAAAKSTPAKGKQDGEV